MKRLLLLTAIFLVFLFSLAQAQDQTSPGVEDQKKVLALVKDAQGETLEGYLHLNSNELIVRSKENKEEAIPVKYIKSITLEKQPEILPGEQLIKPPAYSVRLQNSQDIYTLDKKYTFSLTTDVGIVTKSINPEELKNITSKDGQLANGPNDWKSLIQDKSIIFSLEFKF